MNEQEKVQKALKDKQLILDALLRDIDHPERFTNRIAENNAKIAKLHEENQMLGALMDNMPAAIARCERDIKQLEVELDKLNNSALQQAEKVAAKLKELTKGMSADQIAALLTKS